MDFPHGPPGTHGLPEARPDRRLYNDARSGPADAAAAGGAPRMGSGLQRSFGPVASRLPEAEARRPSPLSVLRASSASWDPQLTQKASWQVTLMGWSALLLAGLAAYSAVNPEIWGGFLQGWVTWGGNGEFVALLNSVAALGLVVMALFTRGLRRFSRSTLPGFKSFLMIATLSSSGLTLAMIGVIALIVLIFYLIIMLLLEL